MKSSEIRQLEMHLHAAYCAKHSTIPPTYIPHPKRTDKTANGLTQCIIDFIELQGWQAERIAIMGRPGETPTGIKWSKSNMTKGTADISATIKGMSVKIEVKIGADKQSAEQLRYQKQIESAGGKYFVARNFASFVEWFKTLEL